MIPSISSVSLAAEKRHYIARNSYRCPTCGKTQFSYLGSVQTDNGRVCRGCAKGAK